MSTERGLVRAGARFYGYYPDTEAKRTQKDVRRLLAAASSTAIPEALSFRAYEEEIYDQGQSAACGGHGSAQLSAIAFKLAGAPLGFAPSPGVLYTVTRCLEREATTEALQDIGIMPGDLVAAHARYGIRPMRVERTPDGRRSDVWTADDVRSLQPAPVANINDEPDVGDLEVGATTLIVGEHRIDERLASEAPNLVRQTLAVLGAPVGVGMLIGREVQHFHADSPAVGPTPKTEAGAGGHWFTVIGYRPSRTIPGEYEFEVCNSWGAGYGDAGHFWLSEAALASASDLYAWTARVAA